MWPAFSSTTRTCLSKCSFRSHCSAGTGLPPRLATIASAWLAFTWLIKRLLGIHADQRPGGARSHAAGAAHQHRLARMPRRPSPALPATCPRPGWRRPGPCRRSPHSRTSRSPGGRFWLSVRAPRLSFHCPPFQLLEHLLSGSPRPPLRRRTAPPARGCRRPRSGPSSG